MKIDKSGEGIIYKKILILNIRLLRKVMLQYNRRYSERLSIPSGCLGKLFKRKSFPSKGNLSKEHGAPLSGVPTLDTNAVFQNALLSLRTKLQNRVQRELWAPKRFLEGPMEINIRRMGTVDLCRHKSSSDQLLLLRSLPPVSESNIFSLFSTTPDGHFLSASPLTFTPWQ